MFCLQLFALAAILVGAAVVAAAPAAQVLAAAGPPVAVAAKLADSEFDPNPQYSFAYDVQDAITGDSKSQIESRSGGVVQGQYRLVQKKSMFNVANSYLGQPQQTASRILCYRDNFSTVHLMWPKYQNWYSSVSILFKPHFFSPI